MAVVGLTVAGHRADITLNRPDVLNAVDFEVFDALGEVADTVAAHGDVRVVVVSGAGRSFCSGLDTGAFRTVAGDPLEAVARAQSGFRKLAALEMPTIAKVHGHALGAGLQIALACDLRIVATDADLGLLEVRYGLIPDLGGTQRLPRLVGIGWAKRMMWLGERIDGDTAHRIGLAEFVTAPTDLDRISDDLAERLAAAPPGVLAEVKALVEASYTNDLQQGMDLEAEAQHRRLTSADFAEAISAFLEKRPPTFGGD